jgi:multimeric flavodoxin WrbA
MKVVTYMGSPRKRGNTSAVLAWVEQELERLGHEVERVEIVDFEVRGCIGCYKCQDVPDEPGCVFKDEDDGDALWKKAIASDLILLATPLYCWGFTAQLKAFVDRSFAVVKNYGPVPRRSLLDGKKIALLVTAMGPVKGNVDRLRPVLDSFAGYTRTKVAGFLGIPGCTEPAALGKEIREAARVFARGLVKK